MKLTNSFMVSARGICNKKGLPIDILKDWKHSVLEKVGSHIKSLSFNLKYYKVNVSLSNEEVKACLSDLHSKYFITPIDKANDNIAFICKHHYALTIVLKNLIWTRILYIFSHIF